MLAETRLIPIFRLAVSPAINKALTVDHVFIMSIPDGRCGSYTSYSHVSHRQTNTKSPVSYRVTVGIASFCIGGWQGLVMVIEQVSSYL